MSEFEYNDNLISCTGNDYDSSFESDHGGVSRRTNRHSDGAIKAPSSPRGHSEKVRLKNCSEHLSGEQSREEKRREKLAILALDAYSRHKKLVNDYLLCYKGQSNLLKRDTSHDKTDSDVLRENHRFLWDDVDTTSLADLSWGQRLAKKYYDKLFKEYCITDLRFYKDNKIAFRWRTDQEVVVGKGQFSCGDKNCKNESGLRSWEVNFAYVEQGERKNALVKVRLCEQCSFRLNYRKQRKEVTKCKKRRAADSSASSSEFSSDKAKKIRRKEAKKQKKQKKKRKSKEDQRSSSNDANSSSSSSEEEEEEEKKHSEEMEKVKVIEEKHLEDNNPWSKPLQREDESNIEDEFDSFLDDMFM